MSKKVVYPDCQYQNCVECSLYRRKCETCGWNPEVKEERLRRIRERLVDEFSQKEDEEA